LWPEEKTPLYTSWPYSRLKIYGFMGIHEGQTFQ
jgi:hypothetical protein